jgi:hypothetical protein
VTLTELQALMRQRGDVTCLECGERLRLVGRVKLHEQHALRSGDVAVVAQHGSRWFVLLGHPSVPVERFDVTGPYDTHALATNAAVSA